MNFDRMREVILDNAVRGELVSQLAEDGVVAQIGNTPKEALQKPLFPSRIEQNRSVRFFFTTSKNGVFLPSK